MHRLRVVIVSEHASAQFGGEAALPLHYFRVLRTRGHDVWLITHARTRSELANAFPDDGRILYVEDTAVHRFMWRLSRRMPSRVAYFTVGFVSRLAAQLRQRRLIRRLVREERIDVIHQPMPVSPREPSLIYGFGVPVLIGPMNGGMDYPPSFMRQRRAVERLALRVGRVSSSALNWLMPGKRFATFLIVANKRTREALPPCTCKRVIELVENGVDVQLWCMPAEVDGVTSAGTTFVFLGRLVDWKAVDLLLQAFHRAATKSPMQLLVIGDGPERASLEAQSRELGILSASPRHAGGVFFAGWLAQQACARELQQADCLVLPSLLECGGAVVLEAMSTGKPVIATDWGGPADYLDSSCGVLVAPTDREALIEGLSDAMVLLARSPALRAQLGQNGRAKVVRLYDWEVKVDQVLSLYERAIALHAGRA